MKAGLVREVCQSLDIGLACLGFCCPGFGGCLGGCVPEVDVCNVCKRLSGLLVFGLPIALKLYNLGSWAWRLGGFVGGFLWAVLAMWGHVTL